MDALVPEAQVGPMLHDVTVVTTKKYACAKVMGVPPEEFGIEKNARSIQDANYAFHDIVTKTEGQMIAEGFDETQVKAIATWMGTDNLETTSRDTVSEHSTGLAGVNSAGRITPYTEHYIRLDYEGNGKPSLYMILTGYGNGEILRKTVSKDGKDVMEDCVYPIDAIPFAATTPVPMTHRFIGRSIADLVMDIQRVKTALLRAGLDNIYLHVAPRPVVSENGAGPNTIDDLLTVRQGSPIRVKGDVNAALTWQTVPDITPSIFPALQYMDATRETRTGLSNQSQGLDANALQNQSATAVAQVYSASQMRLKLVARILAEGVKDIFSLLHATIRKHGQQSQTVRLRNQWVDVDPRNWKTRDDMTIHVGLGTGDKAQQYAQVMGLANFQKELIMGGKGHMVPDAQLFNTASELVKLTGRKNPDKFFADPSETTVDPLTGQQVLAHPPAPPQPNPDVIKAQGQLQIEQAKGQRETAVTQLQAQKDQQKAELDAYIAKLKAESDVQIAREKAVLEREKALLDAELKRRADERAHQLHHQQMTHAQQQHEHSMAQSSQQHQQGMQAAEAKNRPSKVKGDAIAKISDKVDASTKALTEAVKELKRPRKVVVHRDPKSGRMIGGETS